MFAFIFHNFSIVFQESDTNNFSSLGDTKGPFKGRLLIFNFKRCERDPRLTSFCLIRSTKSTSDSQCKSSRRPKKARMSRSRFKAIFAFFNMKGIRDCDSRVDSECAKR